jgi:hypothetical protein
MQIMKAYCPAQVNIVPSLGIYHLRFFLQTPMLTNLRQYIKRLLASNRTFFHKQASAYKGFVVLLFKQRNTGQKWTKEDKTNLKRHIKTMALSIPALIVFIPPGGSIFLPLLVDLMDRRKDRRPLQAPGSVEGPNNNAQNTGE